LCEKGFDGSGARKDILVLLVLGSRSSGTYNTCMLHSHTYVACAAYPLNRI